MARIPRSFAPAAIVLFAACAPAVRLPVETPSTPAREADSAATPAVQTPPGTDVYLVPLTEEGESTRFGALTNLTRRPGYDNQPGFTLDGAAVLYTSVREDGQADIYRVTLQTRTVERVTSTAESEYSPTITPDGRGISVIRVEVDSTQRLWRFDLDGTNPRLILEDVKPVGYHAWGDASTLALFVLGDPPTLQLADTRTGRAEVIARNIGRSLHKIPRRNAISFVEKVSDTEWWIRSLDLATRQIAPLVRTLPGSEDYAWLPDGALLMGQGSKLFRWNPATGGEWREIADFSSAGVANITRLAVSPRGDRLALVANEQGMAKDEIEFTEDTQYAVRSTQYAVRSTQYAVRSTQYAVRRR